MLHKIDSLNVEGKKKADKKDTFAYYTVVRLRNDNIYSHVKINTNKK